MRHATVWAIQEILFSDQMLFDSSVLACKWVRVNGSTNCLGITLFGAESAYALKQGLHTILPDCPECAVLVDLAIQLREESQSIL